MKFSSPTRSLFGGMIKNRRAELETGLREFCEKISYDPSNWSKIERGIFPPPQDETLISKIAAVLDFSVEEIQQLRDFADLDRDKIPKDISEDEYVLKMLPAFMRTVQELKPSENDMDELLKLIREDFKKKVT